MKQEELQNRLSEIKEKLINIQQTTDKRIYLLCEVENSYEVNRFLFEDLALRFMIVTGIDSEDCFEALYHYSNDKTGCVVTIKVFVRDRENPAVESITPLIPGAEWIERELHDVLGINIINHPNLRRLILADDWPEGVYPLRKEIQK
ncbi:MAG: NADH-quinone oxidoreductase subunit C [Planctomycetota bacterium]|jgi:Ni,Fe-hydrogenase III component G